MEGKQSLGCRREVAYIHETYKNTQFIDELLHLCSTVSIWSEHHLQYFEKDRLKDLKIGPKSGKVHLTCSQGPKHKYVIWKKNENLLNARFFFSSRFFRHFSQEFHTHAKSYLSLIPGVDKFLPLNGQIVNSWSLQAIQWSLSLYCHGVVQSARQLS